MKNGKIHHPVGSTLSGHAVYENIISCTNLLLAWREFLRGKSQKLEVMQFARNFEDNLFCLRYNLKEEKYQHGAYKSFFVFDPKKRHIHKAPVCDRVLHHAIVRVIEPFFDLRFVFDSYSCRDEKGAHAALERLYQFGWKLSQNNTKTVWVLKYDIKDFFNSIDHGILKNLLARRIQDFRALNLLHIIIDSFHKETGKGLPLGNLTSQLFANVYLNELDQFIKMTLRAKYYIRYCDDFVILDRDRELLGSYIEKIGDFLAGNLTMQLHPRKVSVKKYHQGVDFLGFLCFPHYRILRTKTKLRMFRKLEGNRDKNSFISYLGLVKHSRSRGVRFDMIQKII